VDVRRLRVGEWLAGIGGAALLGSLFLDWYEGASGWRSFSVVDVLLALAAGFALALAVTTAAHKAGAVPIALASLLGSAALVALLLVLWRAIDAPGSGHAGREAGLWVGLAASAAMVAGAFASMKDERYPEAARSNVPIETLPPPESGPA
jgi:hypothetical protein